MKSYTYREKADSFSTSSESCLENSHVWIRSWWYSKSNAKKEHLLRTIIRSTYTAIIPFVTVGMILAIPSYRTVQDNVTADKSLQLMFMQVSMGEQVTLIVKINVLLSAIALHNFLQRDTHTRCRANHWHCVQRYKNNDASGFRTFNSKIIWW